MPDAPEEVKPPSSATRVFSDYLDLDDHVMGVFFRRCANCSHPLLKELGEGLLNRRLWKCVDLSHLEAGLLHNLLRATEEWLLSIDESREMFQQDTPKDTPYRPYDPSNKMPEEEEEVIWLERPGGGLGELSIDMPSIAPLSKSYVLIRYYFPERLRDWILAFIDDWQKRNR